MDLVVLEMEKGQPIKVAKPLSNLRVDLVVLTIYFVVSYIQQVFSSSQFSKSSSFQLVLLI